MNKFRSFSWFPFSSRGFASLRTAQARTWNSPLSSGTLGGDESRWGAVHIFMLRHLVKRFDNLVSASSLSIWVAMRPMIVEAVRSKHSTLWGKNKDARAWMLMVSLVIQHLWINGYLRSRNMSIRVNYHIWRWTSAKKTRLLGKTKVCAPWSSQVPRH